MTESFDPWVGRTEEATDTITLRQARQLAATLDADAGALADGGPLPPLWHWIGWAPDVPMAGLGPDGHPARGGFLPPVPLERRMWAGGRLTFHAAPRIGEPLHRRSEILKVADKTGSTGRMVFVTVGHSISTPRGLAVTEEQDIVYIAMPDTFTPPAPVAPPEAPLWQEAVPMDTVRLFRFSAVTFNAHRIHFDSAYAAGVEKYPGLVVHGPMQAMLLLGAAIRHRGAPPASYQFRGVRPAFHQHALHLMGSAPEGDTQTLQAVNKNHVTMQAKVGWS